MVSIKTEVPQLDRELDSPGAMGAVKDLLKELDRSSQSVTVDVQVVGIARDPRHQDGVLNVTFEDDARAGIPSSSVPGAEELAARALVRGPFVIKSALGSLIAAKRAKILADLRLTTLADESVLAWIGQKKPVVYFDPVVGQFQVQSVEIGFKVDIKPSVAGEHGELAVELTPEVSTMLELVSGQYPAILKRRTTRAVRVKPGETILLGGLFRSEEIEAMANIPWAAEYPVLVEMFRTLRELGPGSELVLLISPRLPKAP